MSATSTTPGRPSPDLDLGGQGGLRERLGSWQDALRTQSSGKRGVVLSVLALLVLVIYFWIKEPNFLGTQNLTVMMGQAGPLLIISLGATFVILMGSIDLSVGAVATLAGAVGALLITNDGWGTWPVIIACVAAGAAAGLMNAILSTWIKLPSFIVTLGTMSIFTGITLHLLGGKALLLTDIGFTELATKQTIKYVPNVMLVAFLLWLAFIFINQRTRFGRYITAIGAGEKVAELSGIRVTRFKTMAFVFSGATAALGGVFLLSRLGSATPDLASNYLLNVIAAIVVGGTALTGGVGGASRTLLGVALITVLSDGLNVTGVSPFTQEIVTGGVVILAILVTIDRKRMQGIVK